MEAILIVIGVIMILWVVFTIISGGISLIVTHWILLLSIAVVSFIAYYGYNKIFEKSITARRLEKEKSARDREEEDAYIQRETEKAKAKKANEILDHFSENLHEGLVIDSNIWMNKSYDSFFKFLEISCWQNRHCLTVFGVQFDEVCNIKKKAEFGEVASQNARLAISRIESFQKSKWLMIDPISNDANKSAYADPEIVRFFEERAKRNQPCVLISDDKELRTRVRQKFVGNALTGLAIWDLADNADNINFVVTVFNDGLLS